MLRAWAFAALLSLSAAYASSLRVAHPAAEIDWKASGSLPPGAEYHLVREDPITHGVQILVRFPAGYSLPEHAHASDETLVVLKGKLLVTEGGTSTTLGPGSYALFPAGRAHALAAKGWNGCELLVSMAGAFDIKGLRDGKSAGQ